MASPILLGLASPTPARAGEGAISSSGPVVVHGQVRPCVLRASWMVGGFCAHHSAALRGRTALTSATANIIVQTCDQRALISPTLRLPGQSRLVEASHRQASSRHHCLVSTRSRRNCRNLYFLFSPSFEHKITAELQKLAYDRSRRLDLASIVVPTEPPPDKGSGFEGLYWDAIPPDAPIKDALAKAFFLARGIATPGYEGHMLKALGEEPE